MSGNNFDVTRIHAAVFAVAFAYGAGNGNNAFLVETFEYIQYFFSFRYKLCGSVKIAQDNESQASSDFPYVFHPAAQLNGFSDICNS